MVILTLDRNVKVGRAGFNNFTNETHPIDSGNSLSTPSVPRSAFLSAAIPATAETGAAQFTAYLRRSENRCDVVCAYRHFDNS
jgi:hypothetical protein